MYLVWNFIRLQAVQKFACRITSGTRKYDHLTPFLKKNWDGYLLQASFSVVAYGV